MKQLSTLKRAHMGTDPNRISWIVSLGTTDYVQSVISGRSIVFSVTSGTF